MDNIIISDQCPHVCQADSLEESSVSMFRVTDLLRRARETLRREGLGPTLTKVLRFAKFGRFRTPLLTQDATSRRTVKLEPGVEVLDLLPGEWVEVKSLPEILATLDGQGKLRGLEFLPAMHPFCGKRFKVLKRMETLYQEESRRVRRLKHTVLLSEVQCDGLLMRCDRSCYLFWREAWLRQVTESPDSDCSP